MVEFVPHKPSESLTGLQTSRPAACDIGHTLNLLGSFEEQDVDDAYNEGDLWTQTEHRFVQSSEAHRGRNALALVRNSADPDRTSTWLVNKVSVDSGRQLTLTGFHKRDNAGDIVISVRWMTASDTHSYATDYQRAGGSSDWERFALNLTVPDGADGVKIYYRHYPPLRGEGVVFLDDLSLVEWREGVLNTVFGISLKGPNDWRFLRCRAENDGPIGLTLTRTTYSRR